MDMSTKKEPLAAALRRRFLRLAASSGIDSSEFDQLDACYSEPGRHYHNWHHINECLQQLDSLCGRLADPLTVEIALWYHDAVYLIGSTSNECESAELAYAALAPVDQERAWKVRSYIIETDYSVASCLEESDLDYLKDIDHYSFAKPFDEFWDDVQRLLLENESGSSSQSAAARRIAFYQSILDGEKTLFRTAEFRHRCLPLAHANLQRAIVELQGNGERAR